MKPLQNASPRRRLLYWLGLSLLLTWGWWSLYGRVVPANLHLSLALYQGVPVLLNLGLAWWLGLLGARTAMPATLGIVMASIALPYIVLTLLLTAGCAVGLYFGMRGACL